MKRVSYRIIGRGLAQFITRTTVNTTYTLRPGQQLLFLVLFSRGKEAYSVPIEVCIGLFRPGLYTLAASCARTGTWTSVTNAGAMVGAYAWSAVAGSSIQAIVTGETIAVHQFMAANGGYAVVLKFERFVCIQFSASSIHINRFEQWHY